MHHLPAGPPLSARLSAALRRLVLHYAAPVVGHATALHWGSWPVPIWLDVVIVAGVGAVLLGIAAWLFSRPE